MLEWLSDWWDAELFYDERPPAAVLLGALALALAGMGAVALDVGGLRSAVLNPVAFAPVLLTVILFVKWIHEDDAVRLVLLVAADLAASAGAAVGACALLGVDPAVARPWTSAFVLLGFLVGAFVHGRSWAIFSWYGRMHRAITECNERAQAILTGPASGSDWVAEVTAVDPDGVRLLLHAGGETRPGVAAAELIDRKPQVRAHYIVSDVRTVEEPTTGGNYRDRTVQLRITEIGKKEFLSFGFRSHVSYASYIAVASVALLAQHALLAALATLVALGID